MSKSYDPSFPQGSSLGPTNGWIELVLIEAKDLVAADIRGTSDPYVRVQYGKLKKRTKVSFKFLFMIVSDSSQPGEPLQISFF